MRSFISRVLVGAALLALAAPAVRAQQDGPRWRALIGCWSAVPAVDAVAPAAPLVCIAPTSEADVATLTTIVAGKVTTSQRVDGSSREQPVDARGCSGTQRARWSKDGRRLFLESTATCDNVPRTTTGILAIAPNGDWLDIQGVVAGEGENVRVARYHDAAIPSTVPAEIAEALRGREQASRAARVAAGAPARSSDVIEASRAVSAAVTEAWVLERGQAFPLDAHELITLADAGVPARVTDALVAVSNPQVFAISHPESGAQLRSAYDTVTVAGRRLMVTVDPFYSPYGWGYGPYGYYSRYYGLYSPYGYYSPYTYPLSGYGLYGPPVIVVPGSQPAAAPHGRMVKGHGYVPHDPGTTTATPSTSSSRATTTTSTATGSSPASAPAPAPAPAPARTAHPRP